MSCWKKVKAVITKEDKVFKEADSKVFKEADSKMEWHLDVCEYESDSFLLYVLLPLRSDGARSDT
jgi:hypothetical protein